MINSFLGFNVFYNNKQLKNYKYGPVNSGTKDNGLLASASGVYVSARYSVLFLLMHRSIFICVTETGYVKTCLPAKFRDA